MTPYYLLPTLGLLLLLSLAGCSSQPRSAAALFHDDLSFAKRQRILHTAERLLGAPYRPGGETPAGLDCSGLVQYAYGQAGLRVPRTTRELFQTGYSPGQLQPADLLFFDIQGGGVSHVGLYAGSNQMIHVSSGSGRVSKISIDRPYWRQRLVGSRSLFN